MEKKKIVVIGGGTGTVSVLNGIKQYDDVLDISVVVTMMDDGGSNHVVRDEFGLLPMSDLRKSIIGLARGGNSTLRELFMYRFDKGEGLSSHTLGNLIMMALSDLKGSEAGAIEEACKLFGVRGKIIPVTFDDVRLVAKYSNGEEVTGEHLIDEPENFDLNSRIEKLSLDKEAEANPGAINAINEADFIVIGPGDLYTSTISNIVVKGIADSIQKAKAKVIFVDNLMTKNGQTHGMKASDLVREISNYCGRRPDIVLENNRKIPNVILEKYAADDEFPIEDDLNFLVENIEFKDIEIIREDLIGEEEIKRTSGDTLKRSLVRHDSKKLAKLLFDIFNRD